jgi:outer membrane protein assembly factor BamD (BamD/ComL family)
VYINSFAASVQSTETPTVDADVTVLYKKGKSAFHHQEWDEALQKFQELYLKYPTHPHAEEAKLYVIGCLIYKNQLLEAITATQSFIEQYPQSKWRDLVWRVQEDLQKKRDCIFKIQSDFQRKKKQTDLENVFSSIGMGILVSMIQLKRKKVF